MPNDHTELRAALEAGQFRELMTCCVGKQDLADLLRERDALAEANDLLETELRSIATDADAQVSALKAERDDLAAKVEALQADAERWRALPEFRKDHQIDYVRLLNQVVAAKGEQA